MTDASMPDRCLRTLTVDGVRYHYHALDALAEQGYPHLHQLPVSIKVLLENQLRHCDGTAVTADHVQALLDWQPDRTDPREIMFMPVRVLMQDFTGVPAVVDLAAMRDAVAAAGGDPAVINPVNPVDLVIDHSVMVDRFADPDAYRDNVALEMDRNRERYQFLRWGQRAFNNFRVVPPGTGICHQVNLEYLARTVWTVERDGNRYAYPDTLVGTDSHTTMVNGLAVLGWGVGGIEAEAAMLGQPLSMNIPEVVGFHLSGTLPAGVTATDLVLTVAQMLRRHGVVGKFVEFHGPGLAQLSLADRATIANMAPEYGATCCYFAVDEKTLDYLRLTGRDPHQVALVEAYSRAQGLWRRDDANVRYSSRLTLDLGQVEPCVAGPRRPQDRVPLRELPSALRSQLPENRLRQTHVDGQSHFLSDGDVVIAAITSCTNTSNPAVMLAAGLLARNALARGLRRPPWVKTSLAPGSKVVTTYLRETGLQDSLDRLGFNLVGYGCTTCIGNSGPLPAAIEDAVDRGALTVSAVLSGNRNFEGRIHPKVRANWLASPPLVVAFALAGTTDIDLSQDPLGTDPLGKPVYLRDIWPQDDEIAALVRQVDQSMFSRNYADVFQGDEAWNALPVGDGKTYPWDPDSTYIREPPFCERRTPPGDLTDARILLLLGDSITTDHISPAGTIAAASPAGHYLQDHGIPRADFNSYGARRGNHEVMLRGTFANLRIRNEMLNGIEGGYTRIGAGTPVSVYEAAMTHAAAGTPLVVIAGKEYGSGSSRDWAAKGSALLGIRAVIAESFERIHRANLAGMGILPLEFPPGVNRQTLALTGDEVIDLVGLQTVTPGMPVTLRVRRPDGTVSECALSCRLDTPLEVAYYTGGGIMPYVVARLQAGAEASA